jgi:hypothetical protein
MDSYEDVMPAPSSPLGAHRTIRDFVNQTYAAGKYPVIFEVIHQKLQNGDIIPVMFNIQGAFHFKYIICGTMSKPELLDPTLIELAEISPIHTKLFTTKTKRIVFGDYNCTVLKDSALKVRASEAGNVEFFDAHWYKSAGNG